MPGAGKELFKLWGLIGMQGVDTTAQGLKKIDKQARKTQKEIDRLGRRATDVGKVLTKAFTVPLLIVGAAVIKFGADFDKAMTSSTAIMGDLSDTMRKDMRKAAIDVSKVTEASAKEAAEAYFFLASAGKNAAQSIGALPLVAKFAQAGAFDLSRATDLLTDAQSALGLSSKNTTKDLENMTRVSDVLVKANTLANATVSQFSESLTNKAGAALRVLGKDIEEGAAVLAVFADQGLKGAESGSSLNIVLRDLQKSAIKNEAAFKRAKVEVFDSSGEFRNMADVIGDLEVHLGGMSDKQRKAALTTLGFQEKSIAATMSLLGTSEAIRGYEKELRKAAGTTNEVAEKQLKNFWSQLGLLKDRLIAVGLTLWEDFGATLNNRIIPLFSWFIEKVELLATAFNKLDPQSKKTVKGFLLIAVALGPVVFLVGKLIIGAKLLVPLFVALKAGTLSFAGAMGVLQKSVLGMTLLIAALVALGWYWFSNWETLSLQLQAIWLKLKLNLTIAANAILQSLTDIVLKGIELLSKVSDVVPGLTDKLNKATIGILKFKAMLFKDEAQQRAATNAINEQAEATGGLTENVKKAIDTAKELIGVKEDDVEVTKKQTAAAKELTKAEKKQAKQREQFDKDILDQTAKLGADKFALLEIERGEAVKEAEKLGADVLAVEKFYGVRKKELLAEDQKAAADFNKKTKDQLDQLTLSKLELLEVEKQNALSKAEELGAEKQEIETLFIIKEAEMREEFRQQEAAKDEEALKNRLTQATSIGNKLNSVLGKFSSNKLARIDKEVKSVDDESRRLNKLADRDIKRINESEMAEEDKAAAIKVIEDTVEARELAKEERLEKLEAKRQKIQRQRAIREKLAALFNIAVNTASAVVEALPNIPLSIVIGALGAAEGIAVATTPLPFFEGGLVQGSDRGVAALVGERNQDEVVFPLEKGIGLFIDGLIERIGEIELPTFGVPELAGAAGTGDTFNLNVGTLIADDQGIKELERRLDTVRIAENQRKGF